MTDSLAAIADGGMRARWMTTLVDLAALILSMFVLLLATRSAETTRVPVPDDVPPIAATAPTLEPAEPAETARVGLVLASLRERLRDAALDSAMSVRATRNGVTVDLIGAVVPSPASPDGFDPADARPLATLLRGLEPELRSVTLTYAGRGLAFVDDDLRRADLLAGFLAHAGLRPVPDPVLTPVPPPGHAPVELHLSLEHP